MAKTRRHVALLRGINVGGKHKLPSKDLRALVADTGAQDVQTYIQSGNVVFSASAALARAMPATLSAAIEERFGFEVPVVVRSAAQWNALVDANPFAAEAEANPKSVHVALLAKAPTKAQVAALDPDRSPPDTFVVQGAAVYLHLPGGAARTKLTNAYFDRTLKTTSTARNFRTMLKLQQMLGDSP